MIHIVRTWNKPFRKKLWWIIDNGKAVGIYHTRKQAKRAKAEMLSEQEIEL